MYIPNIWLRALALAGIIRPRQAEWYRLALSEIRRMAREMGVEDWRIEFWIGQSRGHKGVANAYELRCGDARKCFKGNHSEVRQVAGYDPGNLRGPIHRESVMGWMEACPDFNAPSAHRP